MKKRLQRLWNNFRMSKLGIPLVSLFFFLSISFLPIQTSKKISLRANQRNRARRRLREAYRNLRPYFSGDFDVLLIGRRAILGADWPEVIREMLKLAQRAELISDKNLKQAKQEFFTK